jgi:hypothetical protein
MSTTVCLCANTLAYPEEGGGQFWAYLNWAMGLRSCGCEVIWLEPFPATQPSEVILDWVCTLKQRLEPYGLSRRIALCSDMEAPLPSVLAETALDEHAVREAELLINMAYCHIDRIIARSRRSALIDIDPGLTQIWISNKQLSLSPHDRYFTIGETVGTSDARFSDCGLRWQYTPPCVALDFWPVCEAPPGAAYTTVSHWHSKDWILDGSELYDNTKRTGFVPYLKLPHKADARLELALSLHGDERNERASLERDGWVIREATSVCRTPPDYQRYIQNSRGECSCAKPFYVRLQTAWISDRTLCYLASGKPAVVEHTGQSQFLPDADGLLRFRNFEEACHLLAEAEMNYARHCRSARALAETFFDASKVVHNVLERCL